MLYRFNMIIALAIVATVTIFSTQDAFALPHMPVHGKASIVAKRVHLGRTYSRANAHKIRLELIKARQSK